jgi:hypothetical protein
MYVCVRSICCAINTALCICIYVYRVSHNTWDYKNALGRPLNDNVQSWEVSHFEAKDHTFQTRGAVSGYGAWTFL